MSMKCELQHKDSSTFYTACRCNCGGNFQCIVKAHVKDGKVVAVEPNPDIVHLLKNVPVVKSFNGGILSHKKVQVISGQPRAYCASTKKRFDLVEISLIDAVGLTQTGGYPVVENFTYTVEGIKDYMRVLKDSGILSITVWNKLSPPRNTLTTVISFFVSVPYLNSLQKGGFRNGKLYNTKARRRAT